MVFGGIGCVSLLFSIPMVFMSDDIDEKLLTVLALLLCVALFAAVFALGFYLRDKRPAAQKAPDTKTELPAEKPAQKSEPQPVKADPPASEPVAEPSPPAPEKPIYPEPEFTEATPEFLQTLEKSTLYTIRASYIGSVLVRLTGEFLLFPHRGEAETYVRQSGLDTLSVQEIPFLKRNEILSACRCAGYTTACIYAGNGVYRKATFKQLEAAFHLPPVQSCGIAIPGLMERFHSYQIQIDHMARKQKQTGQGPQEFWLKHMNEFLTSYTAMLLDAPLTLPMIWDEKDKPEVRLIPMKNKDGKTVLHVYSDRFAVEQHFGAPRDCVAVPRLLHDTLQNLKSHAEISGVVLNPGRESIYISREVILNAEYHRNHLDDKTYAEESPYAKLLHQPTRQPTPRHRLYLMPVLFEGETTAPDEPDTALHIWPEAAALMVNGERLVLRRKLPEDRVPVQKPDTRVMHGHLIKNPKTGMEFVPLYSSAEPLLKVFGENARLSVISFGEAMRLSRGYTGVILEPGPNQHIIFNTNVNP